MFTPESTPRPRPAFEHWAPFEVVVFDCDSTLSTVEGIDELARWLGKDAEVAELTRRAMDGDLPLEAVYGRRLELLIPTREHLRRLAQLYADTLLPDAAAVIAALQRQGHAVFIVSGGLAEGVRELGVRLGLPEGHIYAVEIEYNQLAGRWWETWKHPRGQNPGEQYLSHDGGPLTVRKGKADLIRELRGRVRGRAMLIGDGVSDLEAAPAVDLFVGFGGAVSRERVRAQAEVFIHAASLAPVLPLALGQPGVPAEDAAVMARGIALLHSQVTFQDAAARAGLLRQLWAPA
jgi:phosphoserine phosphatase